MPSVVTPAMSVSLLMTTLWPIAITGILPACLRVILNSLQDAGTVIELTSYCIASVPAISVAQPATTAAFSLPGAAVAGAGMDADSAVAGAGAAVSAGAGFAAGSVTGAAVVAADAGAAVSSLLGLLVQATSARAQAAANSGKRVFMAHTPWRHAEGRCGLFAWIQCVLVKPA